MISEVQEEEASLYVLGLLPPEEAARFGAAMEADAELAELVARLEAGAAALGAMTPPVDPPWDLRARIMSRIRGEEEAAPWYRALLEGRPGAWKPLAPWAVAACLALIAGQLYFQGFRMHLLLTDYQTRDEDQQRMLDQVQNRLAVAERENSHMKARIAISQIKIATLASLLKGSPRAMAVVAWDGAAQQGILKPFYLPGKRADQDYQLWIIDPDYKNPVSGGVFDPKAGASFQPAFPISKANKFAVSLERKGGSSSPLGPQGPVVLVSE